MGTNDKIETFDQSWRRAMDHFFERTNLSLEKNLARFSSMSLQDLESTILKSRPIRDDSAKIKKAKEQGLKVLSSFQTLGNIAAQAGSLAFPPAGVCFSALSFLMDIPQKASQLHNAVDSVFDSVEGTFAEMTIWQRLDKVDSIDSALLRYIHNILMKFVDICATCINLQQTGKWKRFWKKAGWILTDDNPVKSELDAFRSMAMRKDSLEITLIYEQGSQTAGNIRTLQTAMGETGKAVKDLWESNQGRSSEQSRQNDLKTILTNLAIPDNPQALIHHVYEEGLKKTNPRSMWFTESNTYSKWVSKEEPDSHSLLALVGDQGSGKSFVATSIFLSLREADSSHSERKLVGHHSFPSRAGKDNEDGRPLETALKCIAAQMADQDMTYRKALLEVCRKSLYSGKTGHELWSLLQIGKSQTKTIYYILLDGLDNLSQQSREELRSILYSVERQNDRVRVLITGTQDALRDINAPTIHIEEHTETDMSNYIDNDLKAADLLQEDRLDFPKLRAEIRDKLLKQSRGSFVQVKVALKKVKDFIAADERDEMFKFLDHSVRDPAARINAERQQLVQHLTDKEIDELNELLVWVEYGQEWFNFEQLEAVLSLRPNSGLLQPLRKKVQGKYSGILEIRNDQYVSLIEEVKEWVISSEDTPQSSQDAPTITANITITNADMQVVQRFFWDLTQHSMSNNFKFDHIIDTLKIPRKRIQVNKRDAHLLIVKRAFEFMKRKPDPMSAPIGTYLVKYLPHHLSTLLELTGLDLRDRMTIGENVYDLVDTAEPIQEHWDSFKSASWFERSDFMDGFWKWLEDEAATSHLGKRDRRWIRDIKNRQGRNRILFGSLTERIGNIWLQSLKEHPDYAYSWICDFLMLEPGEHLENDSSDTVIQAGDNLTDKIAKAEFWCKKIFSDRSEPTDELLWAQRMAETYDALGLYAEAIEQYTKVLDRDEHNTVARFALLKRYNSDGNMKKVERLIMDASALTDSEGNTTQLNDLVVMATEKEEDCFYTLSNIIACASMLGCLELLLQGMDTAIENARQKGSYSVLCALLLYKGIALYHFSPKDKQQPHTAVQHWADCSSVIRDNMKGQRQKALLLEQVNRQLGLYYFQQTKTNIEDPVLYIERLQNIVNDQTGVIRGLSAPKYYLAAYYRLQNDLNEARKVFEQDMETVFDLLSDNTTRNDVEATIMLSWILLCCGEEYNSQLADGLTVAPQLTRDTLAAWLSDDKGVPLHGSDKIIETFDATCSDGSVFDKIDKLISEALSLSNEWTNLHADSDNPYHELQASLGKYKEILIDGATGAFCDICLKPPALTGGYHACKLCYNIVFCKACLVQLRDGTIRSALCRGDHEWHFFPILDANSYVRACKQMVQMDGKMDENGLITGGEVVPVRTWLEDIRNRWGFPKGRWNFQ